MTPSTNLFSSMTPSANLFSVPVTPALSSQASFYCLHTGFKDEVVVKDGKQEVILNAKIQDQERDCLYQDTTLSQINYESDNLTLGTQPKTDEDEVKVVFEDIKVECINIEETEEEGDMSSGSDDDEEDGDELDSNVEKDFTTSISSQEKEKPTFIKPFKKRRRMQQMYYPKSRFISINNNLIFDLTVEEEFRIHNINFRRLTEYTNFVKLMKQKLQSSWEDYKKTIFVSAFSLDKVLLVISGNFLAFFGIEILPFLGPS